MRTRVSFLLLHCVTMPVRLVVRSSSGHWNCYHLLAVVFGGVVSVASQLSIQSLYLFLLHIHTEVELLDLVILFLRFLGTVKTGASIHREDTILHSAGNTQESCLCLHQCSLSSRGPIAYYWISYGFFLYAHNVF